MNSIRTLCHRTWHGFRPVFRLIALALFGVLAAACSEDPALTETEGPVLTTHLYALESESVRLESFDGSGGAIESIGEDLLVVTPKGRFALVFPDTSAERD